MPSFDRDMKLMQAPQVKVNAVEDALHAVLSAIHAEDARREPEHLVSITLMSLNEIAAVDPSVWRVADLVRDPVGRACREEIKRLGKLLFRITGSTESMQTSLARVAAREPQHECKRSEIMDRWWTGIGAGDDIWCP